jgi:hypothetical protein
MGKWSKRAREMQSVRMKERFAARKASEVSQPLTTNKLSVKERLDSIIHHVECIKQQLGE